MVKFMNMVMSLQQIKYTEVYDIRMGYETVALRLAIKNATEEEIEEMLYDPELFHEMTGELLYAY